MKTELDLSNIEGLDESLLDNYSAFTKVAISKGQSVEIDSEQIGDGFFIAKDYNFGKGKNIPNLFKKYIDGTIREGLWIDASGNVPLGESETFTESTQFGTRSGTRRKLIPYPKDKGFVKSNGKGQYFYFEELPELVKNEIARLNKLQSDAAASAAALIDAKNKSAAEQESARKQAEESNRKFQLQKAESEQKAKEAEAKRVAAEKEAEVKIAEQKRLAGETESQTKLRLAETEAQSKEAEAKAKTKKAMIIGGSVLALVAGFFIWKKFR
jgi:hypothetical protein